MYICTVFNLCTYTGSNKFSIFFIEYTLLAVATWTYLDIEIVSNGYKQKYITRRVATTSF